MRKKDHPQLLKIQPVSWPKASKLKIILRIKANSRKKLI